MTETPEQQPDQDVISATGETGAREATILQALFPVATLVLLLSLSVYLFGEDASYGPNQIALCIGASFAATIGWRNGLSWEATEDAIVAGITISLKPILILFSVGVLIGTWILCGTVPAMIYYGVQVLNPGIFYAASMAICGIVALSIGSSWTVAGTLGDLFESKLKRLAGVKDSGALMPGHGGVLDRFDSLLFALPVLYLFLRATSVAY